MKSDLPLINHAPSPMPIFFLVGSSAVLAWLFMDSPWLALAILGVALLPLLTYWLTTDLDATAIILIVAAAIPRISIEISGLKARPEHIATVIVLFVLLGTAAFSSQHRFQRPYWSLPDYLVATYVALNIFSSLFMSIAPGQTFKWSLQQTLAVLPYFLLRIVVNNSERFRKAIRNFLVVGAAVAGFGVFCFFSHLLFNTSLGVGVEQYGDIPGTYGTLYEPNLLGSFCGAMFILMLVIHSQKPNGNLLFGLLVAAAGMAVSLSRAALGATVIASLAFAVIVRRMGLFNKRVMTKLAVSLTILGLILASALLPYYIQRFSSFTFEELTSDTDFQTRIIPIVLATENIAQHPLLGNGTSSSQLFYTWAEAGFGEQELGFWIGNVEMRILHDTGAAGLAVFTGLLLILTVRSIRVVKRQLNGELLALLVSALVYCVAFQTTEGTLLSFPWVHLGLIGCALSLDREASGKSEVNIGARR